MEDMEQQDMMRLEEQRAWVQNMTGRRDEERRKLVKKTGSSRAAPDKKRKDGKDPGSQHKAGKRRKYQLLHEDWGDRIAPSSVAIREEEQKPQGQGAAPGRNRYRGRSPKSPKRVAVLQKRFCHT